MSRYVCVSNRVQIFTKMRRYVCADAQMCVDVKTRRYVQICIVCPCLRVHTGVSTGRWRGPGRCRHTPHLRYRYSVQIYSTTHRLDTLSVDIHHHPSIDILCVDIHIHPPSRYKYLVQIYTTTSRYTKCRSVDIHQLPHIIHHHRPYRYILMYTATHNLI